MHQIRLSLHIVRKNLEGHWKDEESEFWLFETGDFKMVKQDGSSSKGTWKIIYEAQADSSVNCISWAPWEFGLILAAGAKDG